MRRAYIIAGIGVVVLIFALGTTVLAGNFGLDETAGAAKLDTYGNSVPTIAGNVIGTLLSMISVLFFVLVLYGGILWMTARGSSEQTEKALNTIIAATIGIIIIIGAYALTNFVFKLGANTGNNTNTETVRKCTSKKAIEASCLTSVDSALTAQENKDVCESGGNLCSYIGTSCESKGKTICPTLTDEVSCNANATLCVWE